MHFCRFSVNSIHSSFASSPSRYRALSSIMIFGNDCIQWKSENEKEKEKVKGADSAPYFPMCACVKFLFIHFSFYGSIH